MAGAVGAGTDNGGEMSKYAYQYGLVGHPIGWDEDCEEELRLQNVLWNTLVEIDRDIDARRWELVNEGAVEGEEKQAAKTRRKANAEQHAEALAELETERKARVKSARQNSGLWWGNYNAICDSYRRARSKAMGKNEHLQFHPYDGSGRITNQIIGGMSLERLFGDHPQCSIDPVPADAWDPSLSRGERRRRQRTALRLRVRAGKECTWRMVLHRPLPEGAHVKYVTVHRERMGGRWRWSCSVVVDAPEAPTIACQPRGACGLNLGWRQVPEGLRVATLLGADGAVVHYVLSRDWLAAMDHADALQGRMADDANAMHARLMTWDLPWPAKLVDRVSRARRARHPVGRGKRLSELAIAWRELDWQPRRYEQIERWRRQAKLDYEHWCHLRAKLRRQRREAYRLIARDIAARYAVVTLDEMDLSHLAQSDDLYPAARHQRVLACLHELRRWLTLQGAKTGSEVGRARLKSTRTCSICGGPLEAPPDMITLSCQACGAHVDRDENAALNLCREGASGPVMPDGPGSTRSREIKEICQSVRVERGQRKAAKRGARNQAREVA